MLKFQYIAQSMKLTQREWELSSRVDDVLRHLIIGSNSFDITGFIESIEENTDGDYLLLGIQFEASDSSRLAVGQISRHVNVSPKNYAQVYKTMLF